jgi:hypothetical protein
MVRGPLKRDGAVLNSLIKKRSETSGRIQVIQAEGAPLVEDLDHPTVANR